MERRSVAVEVKYTAGGKAMQVPKSSAAAVDSCSIVGSHSRGD